MEPEGAGETRAIGNQSNQRNRRNPDAPRGAKGTKRNQEPTEPVAPPRICRTCGTHRTRIHWNAQMNPVSFPKISQRSLHSIEFQLSCMTHFTIINFNATCLRHKNNLRNSMMPPANLQCNWASCRFPSSCMQHHI